LLDENKAGNSLMMVAHILTLFVETYHSQI